MYEIALAFAAAGAASAVAGTALNRLAGGRVIMLGFALLLLAAAYALVQGPDRMMAGPCQQREDARVGPRHDSRRGHRSPHGFFGVGGGFVIVPALTLVLGLPMTLAVGTSLLVIALTSAAALAAHLATGTINLPLSAAFTLAAIAGAVAGTRLHGQIPEPLLRRLSHCCSSASQHSSSQRTPAAGPASTQARPNADKQRKNRQVRVLCIPRPSRRRQQRQRSIPHTFRGTPPEAPAGVRQCPQARGERPCSCREIPARSRSARNHQDRPVTPEVAGSSPVAPVQNIPANQYILLPVLTQTTAGF